MELNHQLLVLYKYYASLYPTTPAHLPAACFPSPAQLASDAVQEWLVKNLIQSPTLREHVQGASPWRRVFWKRIVSSIEGELALVGDPDRQIHDEILETFVEALAAPGGNEQVRIYYWGPLETPVEKWRGLTTFEDGRMISAGTTGLRSWKAAKALSNYLIERPVAEGGCFLELGAGIGLVSLVSGAINPSNAIMATDVSGDVLSLLQRNVDLNHLDKVITVSELDWSWIEDGNDDNRLLDGWRAEHCSSRWPSLILGADITYDPELCERLSGILFYFLNGARNSGRSAKALIAATIRNQETFATFEACCERRGLKVNKTDLDYSDAPHLIVGCEGFENEGSVVLLEITV